MCWKKVFCKMRQRIRVNIYPKDGYKFTERDGTVLSDSRGWEGLIRVVSSYRRRNKLPIGNPVEEVHAQACAANPTLCWSDDDVTRQEIKKVSLKGRVLRWLSEMIRFKARQPLGFVSNDEARAREDVCQKCPNNMALQTEGCGSCRKAVEEQRKELIGGRPRYKRLNACSVLGSDLQSAVHLDTVPVENAELPQHCWSKRR